MTVDFRRYWPGGQTKRLMKAAFHSDIGMARQAWHSWLKTCDFDKAFWSDLRVASLAHRRLGGSEVAGALEPRLLGLRRYIWSAAKMRIDAARPLLKEFGDSNVIFMPIKGSVLLARDPQAMTDRFIADIDVLVDHASWEKAVDIALKQGWSSARQLTRTTAVHRMRQTHHAFELQRGAHGAVDLHQFSLLLNRQLGADVMLWKRAEQGTLSGIPVLLPHPSDQLAIIFGHCFLFSRAKSFDWVADASATISKAGFDWDLFVDVILDRDLAVAAATALTFLTEELGWSIPAAVMDRIVGQVREPFLSEFAANYRTFVTEVPAEWRAIYKAECIRSRRFIERVSTPRGAACRQSPVNATLTGVKLGQKVVLPMPSGVTPMDRVQFRLRIEAADEWLNASSLVAGRSALVLLRCFDDIPLELGRWLVRRKKGGVQELNGEIDGALVVGRGIDELWLKVTNADPFLFRKLRGLRTRILRIAGRESRDIDLPRKLRGFQTRMMRFADKRSFGANRENESRATILRGDFEATISTSRV